MAITQIANDNNDGFRESGMLDEPIPIGTIFADLYEVINENKAAGGMGEAILCRSKQSNKYYVLKTFKSEKYNEEIFKQEIEFTLKLEKHPNIVYTQTAFKEKDKIYMVMELIGKQPKNPKKDKWFANTLADKLKGQISPKQAFIWAIEFCRGMQYLNSIGLKSHQDIKPANIFITEDNHLKIADFGLSRVKKNNTKIGYPYNMIPIARNNLNIGIIIGGTDKYRSPENNKDCDIRSDIYSFGIALYEMFNGMIDISKRTELNNLIINSKYCNKIIHKCLQPISSNRYQTFKDLEKELIQEVKNIIDANFNVKQLSIEAMNAENYFNKAEGFISIGNYYLSMQFYSKSIKLNPNNVFAYHNRAICKGNNATYSEDWEKIIPDLNKAIKLDSSFILAYENRIDVRKRIILLDDIFESFLKMSNKIDTNKIKHYKNKKIRLYNLIKKDYENIIKRTIGPMKINYIKKLEFFNKNKTNKITWIKMKQKII